MLGRGQISRVVHIAHTELSVALSHAEGDGIPAESCALQQDDGQEEGDMSAVDPIDVGLHRVSVNSWKGNGSFCNELPVSSSARAGWVADQSVPLITL